MIAVGVDGLGYNRLIQSDMFGAKQSGEDTGQKSNLHPKGCNKKEEATQELVREKCVQHLSEFLCRSMSMKLQ